ncbi:MAG TPA: DUF805 domain-containing protein [Xanthomonadales bacterium]|nr:DUF805 domain-containing protein [Xanthomonadales bacterium]
MFRNYFGEVTTGRLARLQYLGHWLLLAVVGLAAFYGAAQYLGITEQVLSGDPDSIEASLSASIDTPALVLGCILGIALIFASMNIMAKRFRDMGLPGWLLVLGVLILSGVLSVYASSTTAGMLGPVVWLLLVLVPSKNG